MVSLVAIGMVVGGAVLLFFGATLSIYGVALLGVVVGGGGGYLVAPSIAGAVGAGGPAGIAVGILVGAVAGLVITYLLLSIAISLMSFIVGAYVGMVAVGPTLEGGLLITLGAGLAVGLGAAFLGTFLNRTAMIFITSFLGAALTSRSVTPSNFDTAASDFTLDPILFDPVSPIFGALFVLGVLSQFGLFKFGYVTKIVSLLPGATMLQDGDEDAASN